MNKDRRKKIACIADSLNQIEYLLEAPKARAQEMLDELNELMEEEQEYIDNMPENFADSEKAAVANEAVENLEEAIALITDLCDLEFCAEEVNDKLNEACN